MRRILLTPGWIARHLTAIAFIVGFTLLGRWQWDRSQSSHGTLRQLAYAFEWVLFAGFVVFAWWKMVQESLHPSPLDDVDPDAVTAVTSSPDVTDEEDPEMAEYNRYLASLYDGDTSR